jgi:hypothetical protein
MGVLMAFVAGWVMGARGGESGYDDVVQALKEIRDSDEFATLVSALRTHSGHVLRQAADWLQDLDSAPPQAAEFMDRVRALVQPGPGGATQAD